MIENKDLIIEVQRNDELAVVRLAGRVVRDNQIKLRDELERLIFDGVTCLAVDLEKVDYMDSSGLGCCSSIHKLLSERGSGAIAVFAASENVEKTWQLIRLDLVIPIYSDRAKAIQWLRQCN